MKARRQAPSLLKRSMDHSGPSRRSLRRKIVRFTMVAAIGTAVWGSIMLLRSMWAGAPSYKGPILMWVCSVVSLGIGIAVRAPGIRRSTMMDLAFLYQVLLCGLISLSEVLSDRLEGGAIWGVSWVCVAMVVFPAVLPYRRFPMILAAVMSAVSGPVMYAIATPILGRSYTLSEAIDMYLPNFITLGIATSTIFYVSAWVQTLARARQMGSYRLVEQIGAGGMGEVWQAEHETLARPAAIKIIHTNQPGFESQRDTVESRFYREAQATAALNSAHTVTVYDYGTTRRGDQYYVMELLDGITLQEAVTRYGPMPPERVINLMIQICHSLVEAHESGLVHRDLKPANMILCQKGQQYDFLKVLDFGLVKPDSNLDEQLTQQSELLGTPAYTSPEAARGQILDHRADIYSLGCVAYFLLSGSLLFSASSPVDLIFKHVNDEPDPIADRVSGDLHPGLATLVMRCIEKQRVDRPQDCGEILDQLESFEVEPAWTRHRAREWWLRNSPPKRKLAIPAADAPTLAQ